MEQSGPPLLPGSTSNQYADTQLSPGDWAQHQALLRDHGQQEQQQQCTCGWQQWQPAAAGQLHSVLESSHASSRHHRRSQSHLSSCSYGDASDTDAESSHHYQRCAAAPATASSTAAVQPACSFAAMDAAAGLNLRDAAAAGCMAVGSQLLDQVRDRAALTGLPMHTGRDAASSNSNSGLSVMQLGAGSHLYPAGSPEHRCCACQQSSGQASGAASSSNNNISSSSSAGGSPGAVSASAGSGQQQHLVAPLTWQQLQMPLRLPISHGQQRHDAGVPGVQGSHRHQPQAQQNTLPGIAELLRLRHEPPLLQGQESGSTIPSRGQSYRAARRGSPAAALSPEFDTLPASNRHPSTCGNPRGTAGDESCPRSTLDRATAATAGLGGSRAATPSLCSDTISSKDTALAALLMDNGFVFRVLASLPGVDPASDLVQTTVAELQQALSGFTSIAPQHNMQLP